MVKIEQGKYYRMRNGGKAGPAEFYKDFNSTFVEVRNCETGHPSTYFRNGERIGGVTDPEDITEEWHEGPVRTVSKKEIVPGIYGRIDIYNSGTGGILYGLNSGHNRPCNTWVSLNSDEMRDAAKTLTELADALDDGE